MRLVAKNKRFMHEMIYLNDKDSHNIFHVLCCRNVKNNNNDDIEDDIQSNIQDSLLLFTYLSEIIINDNRAETDINGAEILKNMLEKSSTNVLNYTPMEYATINGNQTDLINLIIEHSM